jgi:hypothetical protein
MEQEVLSNQQEKPNGGTAGKAIAAIPVDEHGRIVVADNVQLLRYCKALIEGSGVPERFDNPAKLFAALMYVRDLKLPDTAIRQVASVHGSMCLFGDLPLALAQRTGEMVHFKEQWFDANYNVICFENKNLDVEVYGAVCFMKRKGHSDEVQSFAFTMKDAKEKGLYPAMKWGKVKGEKVPNPDAPWAKWTAIMLRYKARSIALKSLFADAISGAAIAEYDFDELPEMKDVTPREEETRKELEKAAEEISAPLTGDIKAREVSQAKEGATA